MNGKGGRVINYSRKNIVRMKKGIPNQIFNLSHTHIVEMENTREAY
jgi:hypothetical protein